IMAIYDKMLVSKSVSGAGISNYNSCIVVGSTIQRSTLNHANSTSVIICNVLIINLVTIRQRILKQVLSDTVNLVRHKVQSCILIVITSYLNDTNTNDFLAVFIYALRVRHKITTLFQRAIQINRITADHLLEFGLYLLFRSLRSASINGLVQLGIKSRISSEITLHLVVCILAVVDSCNNA